MLAKSLYQWRAAYLAVGCGGARPEAGSEAWRARGCGSVVLPGRRRRAARPPDERAQARIAELERLVGRQQADLDFFREALRSWDEKRRASDAPICSPSSKK